MDRKVETTGRRARPGLARQLMPGLLFLALSLYLSAALPLPSDAVERRLWTGYGQTSKASESANWDRGTAPRNGDRVVFGKISSRDCQWDYDVKLSSITLTHAYKGRVSLGSSRIDVQRNVRVAGGVLDLSEGNLYVGNLLYMDQGGTVQLSGGQLHLGPGGLLVDMGGVLKSTGDKPARITSKEGAYFPFVVGVGTVDISNKAGTVVERSKGIVLYSRAKVERAEKVQVKEVAKGSPGVEIYTKDEDVSLQDWSFDESVETKVSAPNAAAGRAKVVLTDTKTQTGTEVKAPPVELAPVPVEEKAPPVEPAPVVVEKPDIEEGEEEAVPETVDFSKMRSSSEEDQGVKVTPLLSLQVLGGQYFFKGQRGNLTGNMSVLAAPAIRFNSKWTLIPTYAGSYQGTKQVVDLVGAGSLFQERMNHRIGAKGIYTPGGEGPWRIKPAASFKWEMLNETRDETWGNGLFDTQKISGGIEGEYVYREPFSIRASYDYAYTRFPNYTTLESQQTFDFKGQPLARELVGGRILDSHSHALTLGGSNPVRDNLIVEGSYILLLQDYPRQRLVNAAGAYAKTLRSDITNVLDVTLRHPRQVRGDVKLLANLGFGAVFARSNQNTYDALNTRFISKYYDYNEYSLRPGVTAAFDRDSKELKPVMWSLNLGASVRQYLHRPTQDGTGVYRSSKVQQVNWTLGTTVSYPMEKNFSLIANLQFGQATSNMDFQQFYKYKYSTLNYLFGVSYEY